MGKSGQERSFDLGIVHMHRSNLIPAAGIFTKIRIRDLVTGATDFGKALHIAVHLRVVFGD